MSLPAPLSHAFPHLTAEIDAERPLISSTLLDVVVTEIRNTAIVVQVTNQHSFDLLTRPSQAAYLDHALSVHFGRPGCSFIFTRPELTTPEQDMGEMPRPASEHVVHASACSGETTVNHRQPPSTALPSTPPPSARNTLHFTERSLLSDWMKRPENAAYVAKNTDATAAGKATHDLNFDISIGNIIGMRNTLGIEKFKPEKPAPLPGEFALIDLIALQRRCDALGLETQNLRIEANTTRGAFNQLLTHISILTAKIARDSTDHIVFPRLPEFLHVGPVAG